jgi:aryl-alcohol dehydrogenase-like predicted oxidoreductase
VSTSQVAVAWLLALSSPILVPIVGATRPEHVVSACDATRLELSAAELERVGG